MRHFHEKLREEHAIKLSYTWVKHSLQGGRLDCPRLKARLAPPQRMSRPIDLSNQMFMVRAGDPDHAASECHTFDKDVLVTSLTPHTHLRGKSMQIVGDLPDGRKRTLLCVPDYQFNWQFTYGVEEPVYLPKATRIEVLAKFDNSITKGGNPDPKINVR